MYWYYNFFYDQMNSIIMFLQVESKFDRSQRYSSTSDWWWYPRPSSSIQPESGPKPAAPPPSRLSATHAPTTAYAAATPTTTVAAAAVPTTAAATATTAAGQPVRRERGAVLSEPEYLQKSRNSKWIHTSRFWQRQTAQSSG